MSLSQSHEFHLVISRSMKESLEKVNVFKGIWSLSGIIVKVLEYFTPVIKREHNWGNQRMSQYKYVSGDPVEKRKHVHVYLPEGLYRELKLIHQDLNVFSIAQMLRDFLDVFLFLLKEYGNKVLEKLESIYKQWERETAATRLTLCQYLRQLKIIIQHKSEQSGLLTLYNNHFSPFWKFRL